LQDDSETFLKGGIVHEAVSDGVVTGDTLTEEKIEQLIQDRLDAKKAKQWSQADSIRDELKAQGVILEDAPSGLTTWRRE
ncbi:MAG: cysteine--tRNA ligase, partial [Methylococcaceae bacterium]|nr:cysteine--tRNA ligase [Methylococcaceae bacterium]